MNQEQIFSRIQSQKKALIFTNKSKKLNLVSCCVPKSVGKKKPLIQQRIKEEIKLNRKLKYFLLYSLEINAKRA